MVKNRTSKVKHRRKSKGHHNHHNYPRFFLRGGGIWDSFTNSWTSLTQKTKNWWTNLRGQPTQQPQSTQPSEFSNVEQEQEQQQPSLEELQQPPLEETYPKEQPSLPYPQQQQPEPNPTLSLEQLQQPQENVEYVPRSNPERNVPTVPDNQNIPLSRPLNSLHPRPSYPLRPSYQLNPKNELNAALDDYNNKQLSKISGTDINVVGAENKLELNNQNNVGGRRRTIRRYKHKHGRTRRTRRTRWRKSRKFGGTHITSSTELSSLANHAAILKDTSPYSYAQPHVWTA